MNICVYGASSNALDRVYIYGARKFGAALAGAEMGLVFGGGASGVMGAAASGALEAGGEVTGVAPSFFNVDGILLEGCTRLVITETMRERKQKMEELSDGFAMLPGGIGTLDEFFEILTLKQLGRHGKAIGVLNVNGYFDPMLDMLRRAADERFMKPETMELFYVSESSEELVDYFKSYTVISGDIHRYKSLYTGGGEQAGFEIRKK